MSEELSNKEQRFVEEYPVDWNATQAAIRAGYSKRSASIIGHENLRKPKIQAALQQRIAELALSKDEVLVRLGEQARGSMGDFLYIGDEEITLTRRIALLKKHDREHGQVLQETEEVETVIRPIARIDLAKAAAAGKLHLIKKYSLTDKGVAIELHDAQAALTKLGEHHRLFGKGVNLNIDMSQFSDDEIDRIRGGDDPLTILAERKRGDV